MRPEKCIGAHFLIPAALTPLVEVVRGVQTSDCTHDMIVDFLKKCGKQTVTVTDSPGFLINRLYLPMVNEAFFALETGLAAPEEIDRACVLGLGLPLGPLAAADAFGLDILLACMNTFHRELGDKYTDRPPSWLSSSRRGISGKRQDVVYMITASEGSTACKAVASRLSTVSRFHALSPIEKSSSRARSILSCISLKPSHIACQKPFERKIFHALLSHADLKP